MPRKKQNNPKGGGIKHDSDKPQLSLISPIAIFKLAQVMTDGAKRYDSHNWRKGFEWTRIADSANRHLTMWIGGMDKDPDSGRSNLAHCMACVMMLLEFEETHKLLDNRYKLSNQVIESLYPPQPREKTK